MFNTLKILNLLIYIIEHKILFEDAFNNQIKFFHRKYKKCITIIKIRCHEYSQKLIKNYFNIVKIFVILKTNFIFKNVNIIFDVFYKLFNI